jgi:hypothetical protein
MAAGLDITLLKLGELARLRARAEARGDAALMDLVSRELARRQEGWIDAEEPSFAAVGWEPPILAAAPPEPAVVEPAVEPPGPAAGWADELRLAQRWRGLDYCFTRPMGRADAGGPFRLSTPHRLRP